MSRGWRAGHSNHCQTPPLRPPPSHRCPRGGWMSSTCRDGGGPQGPLDLVGASVGGVAASHLAAASCNDGGCGSFFLSQIWWASRLQDESETPSSPCCQTPLTPSWLSPLPPSSAAAEASPDNSPGATQADPHPAAAASWPHLPLYTAEAPHSYWRRHWAPPPALGEAYTRRLCGCP